MAARGAGTFLRAVGRRLGAILVLTILTAAYYPAYALGLAWAAARLGWQQGLGGVGLGPPQRQRWG